MKKLTLKDLKMGMKVVPHSKTVEGWGGLSASSVWDKATRMNQPFLYVTQIGPKSTDPEIADLIALDWEDDPNSGDYFLVSDISLYDEKPLLYRCIKAFPGCEVGKEFYGPFDNEEFYQNEEYFEAVLSKPKPKLTIEGYDLKINSEAKTLRWGCREFTFDEFKIVSKAFDVLTEKDLFMGVGRSPKVDVVRYSDIKNILDYITSIR